MSKMNRIDGSVLSPDIIMGSTLCAAAVCGGPGQPGLFTSVEYISIWRYGCDTWKRLILSSYSTPGTILSFTSINSYPLPKNPMKSLLGSIEKMKKLKCSDCLCDMPQGTQLVNGRKPLAMWPQVASFQYLPNSYTAHLHCLV